MPLEYTIQEPAWETTRPLRRVWRWLTEPAPTVQGIENRHQARLLSSLLVLLLPLSMLSILTRAIISPAYRFFLLPLSAVLLIAIVYGLSRTKYYRLGAALIVIALPLFLLFLIIGADFDPAYFSDLLPFLLLGVLLSSLLFGIRGTVGVAAASIGIVLIMSAVIPEVSFSALLWLLALLVLCSAVMGMGILARDALENTRRAVILDSEARYHSLFDDSPIALWEGDFSRVKQSIDNLRATGVSDFKTYLKEHPERIRECIGKIRVVNVNRAALELLEIESPEELEQVIHADVKSNPAEFFLSELVSLAEGQTHFGAENAIKGGTRHVITKRTVVPGYEDNWKKVFVALTDITEQKRAENALRESEAKYRALVEQSLQSVAIIQENPLRFSFVNKAMQELHGYSYEEMIGFTPDQIRGLVHPADRQAVDARVSKRFEGEEAPSRGVHRLVAKDGDIRWLETFSSMIEYGGEPAMITVFVDITERKQAEDALQESQQMLATLMSNLPGMAYRRRNNPNWTMEFVSEGCLALTGYPDSALLGDNQISFSEIIATEDRERVWKETQTAADHDRSFQLTYRIVTADGEERWVWEQGRAVERPGGGDPVLEGFISDITDTYLHIGNPIIRKLEESEAKYRALVEQSLQGMAIVQANPLRFSFVNEPMQEFTGYSYEELIGFTPDQIRDLIYSEDRQTVFDRVARRLAGEELPGQALYRIVTKDGNIRWMETFTSSIEYEGEPAIMSVFVDVTERKQAEEALRESEERYRLLFENSLDGVLVTTPDGRILHANPSACQILGRTEEELQQAGRTGVVDTSDPRLKDALAERARTGEFSGELTFVRKDGSTFPGEASSGIFIGPDGEARTSMIIRDITERRRAEEALRQSEARYRAMIESQIDVVSRYRPDTTLTFVNDAYCQFYGKTREELIGKSYLSMVAPEFREIARQETESMVTDPRLLTGEYLNYAADGAECWIQWVVQPIADENGQIVELQAVGRDITQLKRTEEALRESEESLRAAQENANLGSWEYEIEGDQGRWSQQMFRLFDLEPAEEAPSLEEYLELIHPDDRSQIQETLTNLVEGKQLVSSEYRSNPERGPVRTFWPNSKLIRDQEGRPVKFIGTLLDITKRRQAEDALQESQQMLATLMSNLPGMAYRCRNNLNRTMEFVSEGCLALTGYPDSALLGDQQISFNEIIAPEDRERVWEEIQMAVDHDQPFQLTYRIVTAAGEERWVWEQGRAVERPGGSDPVLEGFVADITETYLTNAALARERDTMEALGQAAQAIQRARKPEEIYEYVGSAIRQLGYYVTILRVSDDQQQIIFAYITAQPEMLSQLEQLAHTTMESIRVPLEPDNLYHRVLVKKNAIFLDDSDAVIASALPTIPRAARRQMAQMVGERIIIAPLIVGDTAYGIMLVTGQDLTEKDVPAIATFATQTAIALENTILYQELAHYAEGLETAVEERTAELRRTRDWAEAVVNSVGEALMVVAPDGHIQQVNPAFEQYTGYTSQEVIERTHNHLVHIDAIPVGRFEEMLRAMRAGEEWLGEMPIRRKDGTIYDAAVTVTPLRDSSGEAVAFVGALRDISAQKEIQRMKDAFVSNVSHELRTPITSLKLNMSLMRMNPQGQEVYIDRLERETGRLAGLIEDLLRLSRLDQGRIKLDLKAVDLNALAARYVEDRIPLAETRELDLRLGDHPDLPAIQADKGLIGQALSVLITNALHYTPAGGEVVISTQARQEDGRQWVGISVRDNGPGISPEDKAHLFERFYRGKAGHNSEQPGTGLGLAIAHEIVVRHGGRMEVESAGVAGQGATFSIWLPVSRIEADRPTR